jgi:hypothetical protein
MEVCGAVGGEGEWRDESGVCCKYKERDRNEIRRRKSTVVSSGHRAEAIASRISFRQPG